MNMNLNIKTKTKTNTFKHVIDLTVLTTIAALGYSSTASAFSFNITKGIDRYQDQTGKIVTASECQALGNQCTTLVDRGAFSDFAGMKGITTIDFDNGMAPTAGVVQFSSETGLSATAYSEQTGIYSDLWAPAGVRGEANLSNYLAVFAGNKVSIALERTMNYFGINWGAMSEGNTFTFSNRQTGFRKTYTYDDVNPHAQVFATQHGGEGNGFVHFYADTADEVFDAIEIAQETGGGFEVDNFSFHEGKGGFDFFKEKPPEKTETTPEPGLLLGLCALGSLAVLKRKQRLGGLT